MYRWEFEKGRKSLTVAVNGPLIVDDVEIMTRAAIDGVGLAFMSEEHAAPHLTSVALVRVLDDWRQPFPGFFLYYPSRRQQPGPLPALIDAGPVLCCESSKCIQDGEPTSSSISAGFTYFSAARGRPLLPVPRE